MVECSREEKNVFLARCLIKNTSTQQMKSRRNNSVAKNLNLMLKSDVSKPLLEHLVNTLIKGRDNFLGVLYQLSVQFGTELLEVLAGYVQVGFL